MKKVIIGLSIALLALGTMGCHKERQSRNVTAENAASAPVVAESIVKIEVKAQKQDPAAPADTALTCKYVLVSGTSISAAETKTSGKCDFNALAGQAAAAGSLSADAAAKIISIISADSSMPNSAKSKWDCKAINVQTNARKVGAQDCADGQGVNDATGKALAGVLGL